MTVKLGIEKQNVYWVIYIYPSVHVMYVRRLKDKYKEKNTTKNVSYRLKISSSLYVYVLKNYHYKNLQILTWNTHTMFSYTSFDFRFKGASVSWW